MTKIKALEQAQVEHQAKAKALLDAISQEILSLPDNPDIKRASSNPHAFIMKHSALMSNNWAAETYDFKKQYEAVVTKISSSSDPVSALRIILMAGKIPLPANYCSITLHPDVVDNLTRLAGFKWKSCVDWPKGTCPYNLTPDHSDDLHDTKRQAASIMSLLCSKGFGGDNKHFPIKTWLELT
jgi:hypothetical protein